MSVSNLIWAKNSAEVFARLGVKHVCISPGSRNSPLTVAFIENKQLTCYSIIDERSNGFFMCGLFSKKDVWVYGRSWLVK